MRGRLRGQGAGRGYGTSWLELELDTTELKRGGLWGAAALLLHMQHWLAARSIDATTCECTSGSTGSQDGAAAPASTFWWLPPLPPPATGCAMARLRLLTLR